MIPLITNGEKNTFFSVFFFAGAGAGASVPGAGALGRALEDGAAAALELELELDADILAWREHQTKNQEVSVTTMNSGNVQCTKHTPDFSLKSVSGEVHLMSVLCVSKFPRRGTWSRSLEAVR